MSDQKQNIQIFTDGPKCPVDGKEHDFSKWVDFPDGSGGSSVCSKCGLTAMDHTLMYGDDF